MTAEIAEIERFNESGTAEFADALAWQDFLRRSGAVFDSTFGLQLDLNAAWRNVDGQVQGASFCDDNCTQEVGNYTCLASTSLNIGVRPKSLAPASTILSSLNTFREGVNQPAKIFMTAITAILRGF